MILLQLIQTDVYIRIYLGLCLFMHFVSVIRPPLVGVWSGWASRKIELTTSRIKTIEIKTENDRVNKIDMKLPIAS